MSEPPTIDSRVSREFERMLSSEALLQQAVAGLLARIPGVDGVQLTHGPSECGKDIIFRWQGAFGEALPCACIIKRSPISGNVASDTGARTVYHQVEQALDSPYVDQSGAATRIHRAYVVSPHSVSQATMTSITGAMQSRSGQIVFIAGHELLRLFQRHWPDFLADEASAVRRYLTCASHTLNTNPEMSRLAMLYDIETQQAPHKPIYVDLSFAVDFSKFSFDLKRVWSVVPDKKELHEKHYWTKDEHPILLKDRFQTLVRTVEHLIACNLWTAKHASAGKNLQKLADDFLQAYPFAWMEYAMKSFGHKHGEMPNLPADARIGLARLDELQAICDRMRECLKDGFRPLENALARHARSVDGLAKARSTADELLCSPNFNSAMRTENAASSFSCPGLVRTPRTKVRFSSGVLNCGRQSLLIVGPAGSGKTSFCRWHALRDMEAYSQDSSRILPVYVALTAAQLTQTWTMEDLVRAGLGASAFSPDDIRQLAQGSPRMRVYLDGLDEVHDPGLREQIVRSVREGVEKNPNLQVIVTCRDYIRASWLVWMPRLSLEGIEKEHFRELASRWFEGSDCTVDDFMAQLSGLSDLASVSCTPLLATLTVLVYKQTRRLPESRTRLYQMFIDLLSGGWDLAKGGIRTTRFARDAKIRVLCCLAYSAHQKGVRTFPRQLLIECVSEEFENLAKRETELMIDELLRDNIIDASADEFLFRHLSFQEFLAARYCAGRPRYTQIRYALNAFMKGDDWWRDVVRFYISMIGGSKDFRAFLNGLRGGERNKEIVAFYEEDAAGLLGDGTGGPTKP